MPRLSGLILSLITLALLSACQPLKPNVKANTAAPNKTTTHTAPQTAPSTPSQAADTQAAKTEPQVLLFLAQTQAAAQLQKVALSDTEAIYVLPQPILTRRDLNRLQVLEDKDMQKTIMVFTLHPDGAKKLADISSRHTGKYLALVVDGTLLALPKISAPLNDGVLGIPFHDRQQAQAAAQAIVGQR